MVPAEADGDLVSAQESLFFLDTMNSIVRETALLGGSSLHALNGAAVLSTALGPLAVELVGERSPSITYSKLAESPTENACCRLGPVCLLAVQLVFRQQHYGKLSFFSFFAYTLASAASLQRNGKSIIGLRSVLPNPARLLDTLRVIVGRAHVAHQLSAIVNGNALFLVQSLEQS